jgi:hypothetical protein
MMAVIVARIFALDVDGKPTLAFEARNWIEAQELCREPWLRADLSSQNSNGIPLCDAHSKLSTRRASAEEAALFGQARGAAEPSDELVLAYLVELDD